MELKINMIKDSIFLTKQACTAGGQMIFLCPKQKKYLDLCFRSPGSATEIFDDNGFIEYQLTQFQ